MKLLYRVLLAALIITPAVVNLVSAIENLANIKLTPENTAIFLDFDGVIAQKSWRYKFDIVRQGIGSHFYSYLQGLRGIRKNLTKDQYGNSIIEKNGEHYNGSTLQLIINGIENPALRPYIASIIYATARGHNFVDGIPSLFEVLRNIRGYSLNIATNKGHMDLANAAWGMHDGKIETTMHDTSKYANILAPNVIDNILVHHATTEIINQLKNFVKNNANIPASFKKVIEDFVTLEETQITADKPHFYHTTAIKPERAYFEKMRSLTDKEYIIFFDNKKVNVDAANAYGHGIHAVQVNSLKDIITFLKAHIISGIDANNIRWDAFCDKIIRSLGYHPYSTLSWSLAALTGAGIYLSLKNK